MEDIKRKVRKEKTDILSQLYDPFEFTGKKISKESKYNKIITGNITRNSKASRYLIFLSL